MHILRTVGLFLLATFTLALFDSSPVHAVDKCKVKVDNKTGVIRVDARDVQGPLAWGGVPGDTPNSFFNDATCVSGDRARKCGLADPATVEAKTPPDGCTIFVSDGTTECQAWPKGCTPGVRDAAQGPVGPPGAFDLFDGDSNRLGTLVSVETSAIDDIYYGVMIDGLGKVLTIRVDKTVGTVSAIPNADLNFVGSVFIAHQGTNCTGQAYLGFSDGMDENHLFPLSNGRFFEAVAFVPGPVSRASLENGAGCLNQVGTMSGEAWTANEVFPGLSLPIKRPLRIEPRQ